MATTKKTGLKLSWTPVNKKYTNFTDLGRYALLVDEQKTTDFNKAMQYINNKYDRKKGGCTACAKRAPNGDVLIGRNMDIEISQNPAYIVQTSFGKYKTLNISYSGFSPFTYAEELKKGKIDDDFYYALPYSASDVMNSEGLYIETNMREADEQYDCNGTHPGRERVCTVCIPALVASNCKTVQEAVAYIKDSYDYYTMNSYDAPAVMGWNYAFMIGDASGEYGLIEIAKDEVSYIAYQYGQGNYYQTPAWNATERFGSGYGRLNILNKNLPIVKDEWQMLDHMKTAMWRNETLFAHCAFRDPSDKIHFVNDKGEEIADWRSDYECSWPVDKNGKLVNATGFEDGYNAFVKAYYTNDRGGILENFEDFIKHREFIRRQNSRWCSDDKNFEVLQKLVIAKNAPKLEALIEYYKGNEKPLRDEGDIWTTSLSIGCNCTKKHFILKLWEKEDTIIEYQW